MTEMKYIGTLLVVKDCNAALKLYRDLFGFELVRDNDGNMELTGGLYLQEAGYWENFIGKSVLPRNNCTELYFEEPDIEAFVEKLEKLYPDVEYVNRLMTHSWGQKVVRFYDPDGNLIEVGTPA
jgi:catechol 2,3-dioxygenase-like lactoylglutathione lyase family enzyme